ncbi:peptidase MA family metallohydrolase [Marininema halotolerans]|uniref:Peptidase MA-like domain-containing protein n=1 Tax=Marininema halotolerans TaxID=1155944 RepID=A0A1I6TNX1_9BACL|nr:hypothetical protein [Marininema halotolerans]SFS90906.1 hypothetical protein SAMN05444972_110180 [Marininema halotolerans]
MIRGFRKHHHRLVLGTLLLSLLGSAFLPGSLGSSVVVADSSLVEREVKQLITRKAFAVNHHDRKAFLASLHPEMNTFRQEQKRWFDDAIHWVDSGSYHLKLLSIIPDKKDHQVRALLEQQYSHHGKVYTVKFPVTYQETEKGWKEADIPFEHLRRGSILVRYSDPTLQEQAHIALEAADRGVGVLGRRFGWHPQERVEVKLYSRPEIFRQSVKLSLPQWAGGWHEAGQAVKLIGSTEVTDSKLFSSSIVHEVTHQMVSELSGDNAAYWLQEGAAEYFQSHLLPGIRSEEEAVDFKPHWSMTQLEALNLERLPSKEATAYYAQCYQFYRFLIEEEGYAKMKQLFSVLKLHSTIDQDSAEKLPLINQRTRSAVEKVYHAKLPTLEQRWFDWLKRVDADKESQKTGTP